MLAIHGGAGRLPAAEEDPAGDERVRAGLLAALEGGRAVLGGGGAALDAVVAAVRELEGREEFNAGRGAVLDAEGNVGLDAAVMEGAERRAGGVIGVRRTAHPIDAALAVLRDGRHVLLAGDWAERFAAQAGLAMVAPEHHVTERQREALAAWRGQQPPGGGTVGAVARDAQGVLAAATSTGGMIGRVAGRVSDSALIGAGTWADDRCAVSATGWGEYFMRRAFAYDVAARVHYAGRSLVAACAEALAAVDTLGGRGGCIALDAEGNATLPFLTRDMPRGLARADGSLEIAVRGEGAPR